MDISELLKSSIITCVELHAGCLILTILLYINMRRGFVRNSRKREFSLDFVYIGSALMFISDCAWTTVSSLGTPSDPVAYIINILYFLSSSAAAAYWFVFSAKQLGAKIYSYKALFFIAMVPYVAVTLFYLLSPKFGLIFFIENGEYVRGSMFYFDPLIKMGYIVFASVLAVACGIKRDIVYLRRNDFNYVLFGAPVLVCGILQTITGVDFNCLGVTLGLTLIYVTGITNPDSENTDAMYSLANSFEAAYIVNMDTGLIRPLVRDIMHEMDMPGMSSVDFTTHFTEVLSDILLPEDRASTLEMFRIENLAMRFRIDNSFSIRYRVREESGRTVIHTASFIQASGDDKQEFLLGINTIHSDSLLYERNEALSHENQRLEQINSSIIESVAKIVDVRDSGSGGHIVRVRKITEILAKEAMAEYPEFNLNEERVRLISSASVLHDVGKIVIPDAVLLKPGRLTKEEFDIMKTHSAKGCDILNMFPLGLDDAFLECALSICRWHHEKYDGKGYPDGLKGDEIPIAAQIVSVADCFDALASDRPYKKAYLPEKALEMIINGECGAFSPKIISLIEKSRHKLIELAKLYNS